MSLNDAAFVDGVALALQRPLARLVHRLDLHLRLNRVLIGYLSHMVMRRVPRLYVFVLKLATRKHNLVLACRGALQLLVGSLRLVFGCFANRRFCLLASGLLFLRLGLLAVDG